MKNRLCLEITFLYFIAVSCVSRYSVDDQYSFDGVFMIPFTEWYARMIDITGEKYKVLYLSKDLEEIEGFVDSLKCPRIRINKMQEYPALFVSNDTIIASVNCFKVFGDTVSYHLFYSSRFDEYLTNDIEIINKTINVFSYDRVLPRYPYIILEFETWHNSFRVIPNWEYLSLDSAIIHRKPEPLKVTTHSFREQNIKPLPLVWIRLNEWYKRNKLR